VQLDRGLLQVFYDPQEDEFDQEDQALLDKIAARYTVAPKAKSVDPLREWLAKEAQLFGRCLEAVVEQLPSASPEDRRYAATVLFNRATIAA
jgi:hypothetical protein